MLIFYLDTRPLGLHKNKRNQFVLGAPLCPFKHGMSLLRNELCLYLSEEVRPCFYLLPFTLFRSLPVWNDFFQNSCTRRRPPHCPSSIFPQIYSASCLLIQQRACHLAKKKKQQAKRTLGHLHKWPPNKRVPIFSSTMLIICQ